MINGPVTIRLANIDAITIHADLHGFPRMSFHTVPRTAVTTRDAIERITMRHHTASISFCGTELAVGPDALVQRGTPLPPPAITTMHDPDRGIVIMAASSRPLPPPAPVGAVIRCFLLADDRRSYAEIPPPEIEP